jgi:quercetin dioxygenase-like cupin family protein
MHNLAAFFELLSQNVSVAGPSGTRPSVFLTDSWGHEEGSHPLRNILMLTCVLSGTLMAQQAKVTTLMSKDLTDLGGKEGTMITVDYPPGSSDPIHRHNAHAFVYVLEGSIVMQVKGGKQVTLTPGQTYYEGPDDIHVVGRNASNTKPARFVVFLIKDKNAPVLIPVK